MDGSAQVRIETSVTAFSRVRSVLFAPAFNERLLNKLPVTGADVVVADLEDSVPATDDDKRSARDILRAWLRDRGPSPADCVFLVRLNPMNSPWFEADLDMVFFDFVDGVVLPKADRDAVELRGRLSAGRPLKVLAGVETANGIDSVELLARSGAVDALYFGAEDYITELGGRRTRRGDEVLYARSRVVMAARLGGLLAVDQVVDAYLDDQYFLDDAEAARDLGYDGKTCLHPRQVGLAHRVFTPSTAELEWAERVARAAREASMTGQAALNVDGRLCGAPMITRAERLLAAAGASGSRHV